MTGLALAFALSIVQGRDFAEAEQNPGPYFEVEVGDKPEAAKRVVFKQDRSRANRHDKLSTVSNFVSDDGTLEASVVVMRDPERPIFRKGVFVVKRTKAPIRLLNLVLDRFPVGRATTEGGDRGFPLYLNNRYFVSLDHPAGFAHVEGKDVVLRQYPGVWLKQDFTFSSMEAIYGTEKPGRAHKLFVDYVRSRMARVRLGHDKPYAILESFGGEPEGNFKYEFTTGVSEKYLLGHLVQVETGEQRNGAKFDYYGLEFWQDRTGDLTKFNKQNFPNGFDKVRDRILGLGMKPGLWIDSGNLPEWSIDLNPATAPSRTVRTGVGGFCRASEPIASMYRDAYLYQIKVNKVGLLKFDNLAANCVNPAHDHLPGPLYSTEAIYNSLIGFFHDLRVANPDVFIMLYWGYRSPWWLQYGDTYFECGDQIEAASPAQYPTPYARDAVTQRLDQAQLKVTDTPWLGKDSLGVWLSDWMWNSSIGKERWQEGIVMDMARGGLLFQLWTDANWLTPPERDQVATFINLMKSNARCFDNTRFFMGDPNNAGPYGYACTDGKKAFLAIDNACMADRVVDVDLGHGAVGLPIDRNWDVYRWYPRPARLTVGGKAVGKGIRFAMRPYEVVLLEVVPKGHAPSLGRQFGNEQVRTAFPERTTHIQVAARVQEKAAAMESRWSRPAPALAESKKGAKLSILPDKTILASGSNESEDRYTVHIPAPKGTTAVMLETLTDLSLPANGPGRAVNGNFAVTSIRPYALYNYRAWPDFQTEPLSFTAAAADFSQTSYGGWPVTAAIDHDPKTGWSIHPKVGQPHVAIFTLKKPLDRPCMLALLIDQGQNHHNLGRFAFSTTSDEKPSIPAQYRAGLVTMTLSVPPTKTGGLLVLEGGSLDDPPKSSIPLKSVWAARSNWACPWTAWRAEIKPSSKPRQLTITFDQPQSPSAIRYAAHFLPK